MKRALLTLVLAAAALMIPAHKANAQVGIAVGVGPAAVVYGQAYPGDGYVWTPGYYAGAVWVPARWVYRGYGYGYGYGYYHHPYYGGYYGHYYGHNYGHYYGHSYGHSYGHYGRR